MNHRCLRLITAFTTITYGYAFAEDPASQEYTVDPEKSVFAVVLYKGGVASALGHNHFISSEGYTVELKSVPGATERTQFSITVPANDLVADDPALEAIWTNALLEAGMIKNPFPEQSESRRAEIAEHMLGAEQLDAEAYPEIRAKVTSIEQTPIRINDIEFPLTVHLAFTVRDQTVTREAGARIVESGDELQVEAIAPFRFTEFGIKPFSAAFGAVKNKDAFNVYVNFTARKTAPAEGN